MFRFSTRFLSPARYKTSDSLAARTSAAATIQTQSNRPLPPAGCRCRVPSTTIKGVE